MIFFALAEAWPIFQHVVDHCIHMFRRLILHIGYIIFNAFLFADDQKKKIYNQFMNDVPMAGEYTSDGKYRKGIEDYIPKLRFHLLLWLLAKRQICVNRCL
jgi:hypothetical protein